jgi:hypothetical protein
LCENKQKTTALPKPKSWKNAEKELRRLEVEGFELEELLIAKAAEIRALRESEH